MCTNSFTTDGTSSAFPVTDGQEPSFMVRTLLVRGMLAGTGAITPQAVAVLLAATDFIAIYLIPNLKYPANPPSVGDPETIGTRTALYFVMIAISLAAMVGTATLKRLFVARLGEWNANLAVAACYIVIVAVAALLLPAVNEVPDEFPAIVLWKFRIASLGAQFIMWATLGLLFGALTQRAANDGRL